MKKLWIKSSFPVTLWAEAPNCPFKCASGSHILCEFVNSYQNYGELSQQICLISEKNFDFQMKLWRRLVRALQW